METKNKRFTEEFKKQIVELYENGKSVIDLAREYGLVEQLLGERPMAYWCGIIL